MYYNKTVPASRGAADILSRDGYVLVNKGFFEITIPAAALASLSALDYVCILDDIVRVATQPDVEVRTVRNVIVHDAKHVTMTADLVGWVAVYRFDPLDVPLLH